MVIRIKDLSKLFGICIVSFCAVFVCTLFLNFNLDLLSIKNQIHSEQMMSFFDAQVSSGKVISVVSGGCLLLTSAIMLIFYIKHYIDSHRKELGILKALGYSGKRIAKSFWIFGLSIFLGTGTGFGASFLFMPTFYRIQNSEHRLPEFTLHFHPSLALFLVILPTILFSFISILYACQKLKQPVLKLLKNNSMPASAVKNCSTGGSGCFLQELRGSTVKSRKTLIFFIVFASFCFSSMVQMSFSMDELSSAMFSVMLIVIGIILASTTLFLAITTVIGANTKTIAMMKAFGYSQKECCNAILNGYRPLAYLGFVIGTIYQYGLLSFMVSVVYQDIENIPEYRFDFAALGITLVLFFFVYEFIMHRYSESIKKISIKEIMLE